MDDARKPFADLYLDQSDEGVYLIKSQVNPGTRMPTCKNRAVAQAILTRAQTSGFLSVDCATAPGIAAGLQSQAYGLYTSTAHRGDCEVSSPQGNEFTMSMPNGQRFRVRVTEE